MTKNIKKTENNIRQKMQEMLYKEDGFSFIEVIIVMAMILVLTAILIPNYLGFVETAREANVKMSAQNMYTAVQMANLTLDSLETSEELYLELKELNPAIIGVGTSYDEETKKLSIAEIFELDGSGSSEESENPYINSYGVLSENSCAIDKISTDAFAGYTFDYYQYMNGKLYKVNFENGKLCDVVAYDAEDISTAFVSIEDDLGFGNQG